MPVHLISVPPRAALPVLARLYGCSEQDFAETATQMTAAWLVQSNGGEALGALGLRPSPAHGAEVMGGTFPGTQQHQAALALLRAALAAWPQLYAYAGVQLPAETLAAAGLHPVGAYTRMIGPIPAALPGVPDGFVIVPLSEVSDPEVRLAAQRTYSDRIGHTHVPDEARQPGFGGSDDALGRLAYDASGAPVGLCRVWLEGEEAALGTPGVHPGVRGTGLRQALLLSACGAAQKAGATRLTLEAWGDTTAERAEDEALSLVVEEMTAIYSSVSLVSV